MRRESSSGDNVANVQAKKLSPWIEVGTSLLAVISKGCKVTFARSMRGVSMLLSLRATVAVAALFASVLAPTAHAADTNVLFIFDASGSMKKEIEGKPRIDVAIGAFVKTVLAMPQSTRTGLMMFGARRSKDCSDIEMISPIGAQDTNMLVLPMAGLQAKGETPIAEAIRQGSESFKEFQGANNSIVLLTDGIEECGGDPCAAAEAVKSMGIDLKVNIVGFTLDPSQRAAIECLASTTGGTYYDAANADALTESLAQATETEAVAQPEPPPAEPALPAVKPRKVIFTEEFEGTDLSPENWEVVNQNTDSYIVEKGNLMTISAATGGLANAELANVFKLKQALPEGDYTVTAKFKIEFATGTESVTLGLFEDKDNFIAASLNAWYARYGEDWLETDLTKMSKGEATGFKAKSMVTSGTGYADAPSYVAAVNAIEQPITLKLVKEGREFRAAANFAGQKDDKGEPVWMTTEPISSLRPPSALVLTTSQSASEGGESTFFIDSITIDVPAE
ncbi:VWA domain-containing protein [Mesorhizobium sp. KR9-304]|uniref:vWA domain-containing protein n=1 Tax=Mesorhizobium sp. KR9-304 TaxID=3156614 RepID=UPI0032B4AC96